MKPFGSKLLYSSTGSGWGEGARRIEARPALVGLALPLIATVAGQALSSGRSPDPERWRTEATSSTVLPSGSVT